MTITTKFTETFGVEHPVVQGGMQWVGRAELVAAVANSGALGFITALTQPTPADLANEIARCRELTDKPFGVNLTILPTINPPPYDEYRQVIVDAGIKIVETAGSNPAPHLPMFHDNGIKVLHKCTSVRHAVKAQSLGVDGISIDGFECAGHPGEDDIPGLVLIPAAAAKIEIPMIASGGFADAPRPGGRAGAGRRRHQHGLAVHVHRRVGDPSERQGSDRRGHELGTELIFRPLRNTARVASNAVSREVVEILNDGGQFEDVKDLVAGVAWAQGLRRSATSTRASGGRHRDGPDQRHPDVRRAGVAHRGRSRGADHRTAGRHGRRVEQKRTSRRRSNQDFGNNERINEGPERRQTV